MEPKGGWIAEIFSYDQIMEADICILGKMQNFKNLGIHGGLLSESSSLGAA